MNALTKVAALSAALLVAAACGKKSTETADGGLDPALQRDLALASAQGVELAGQNHGAQQVVSAVEQVPQKQRPAPAPRRAAASRPEPQPEQVEVGAEPEQPLEVETAVAAVSEEAPQPVQTTEPEPGPAPVYQPTSGPAPLPMPSGDGGQSAGDGGARGRGGWGVIGVVIRGGAVGDDDCDLHRRGRRGGRIGGVAGGIIAVNQRLPRGGVGQLPTGTFPGGGGGIFR